MAQLTESQRDRQIKREAIQAAIDKRIREAAGLPPEPNKTQQRGTEILVLEAIQQAWMENFTEADEQIVGDISGQLIELVKAGALSVDKRATFYHVAVAFLTLARAWGQDEKLATPEVPHA